MLRYFLLLFFLLALAECAVLFWIATELGFLQTVGLVIVTGILGVGLALRQGGAALRRMQQDLEQGRMPGDALLDGVLILVAAGLLFLPGVLTDVFGFALLIPLVRYGVKKLFARHFTPHVHSRFQAPVWNSNQTPRDRIIDVEVIETRSSDVPEATSAEDGLRD